MSTKSLSIVNEGISAPGVAFSLNAVIFTKRLTLDQLIGLTAKVVEVHDGAAWWLGDLGIEIQARNREANEEQARKKDAQVRGLERELEHVEGKERKAVRERIRQLEADAMALRQDKCDEYRNRHAETMGIDPGYWANCVVLSRFFLPSQRCEGLFPSHHRAAMNGARGLVGKATELLRLAVAKGWSASELRRHVNLSLAKAGLPLQEPFSEEWEPIETADKWAIAHKDAAISGDKAKVLLVRWQALVEFLDKLKRIASESTA